MKFKVQNKGADTADRLLVLISKKDLTKALKELSELTGIAAKTLKEDFSGDYQQVHTFYSTIRGKNKRLYLLGLGNTPSFSKVLKACRKFSFTLKEKKGLCLTFLTSPSINQAANFADLLEAALNGLMVGEYNIGLYKTGKTPKKSNTEIKVWVEKSQNSEAKKAIERAMAVAQAQTSIMDLVNAPSNKVRPQELSAWAKKSGKTHGYKVRVLNKKQIESLRMGALLAVNQGSPDPPQFIIMEHKGRVKSGKKLKKVGLVGKGITFDTGGLSIKGSMNMHYMKSDMGGAAAVLGIMEVVAQLNLPIHLLAIVPTTDNSVDAQAIKPGDVITSYSGKTIEIIDTDAEGRLILADGLAYMEEKFKPEVLIDLATLTGSAVRTLGYQAGALFSNNDQLAQDLFEAGEQTGERLWRLPLWDEYKSDIESDVADVRNFSGRPLAGAISAAKFLEVFTNQHPNWAHLDIAGVSFGGHELSVQKSSTGYGIRLLLTFLENLIR